jgi:hypothetical protein
VPHCSVLCPHSCAGAHRCCGSPARDRRACHASRCQERLHAHSGVCMWVGWGDGQWCTHRDLACGLRPQCAHAARAAYLTLTRCTPSLQ